MVASHAIAFGHDKTHNDQIIGIPRTGEIKNSSEVYIKPNEPLVMIYGHHTTCLINASFTPEGNTDYQVLSNTSNGRCSMVLTKVIVNASNEIIYTPVKLDEVSLCNK